MAIQITDKLTDDIKVRIDELSNLAIIAEFGSPNDQIPLDVHGKDAEVVDTLVWGEHLPLRSQIPAKWCEDWRGISQVLRVTLDEKELPGVHRDQYRFHVDLNAKPYFAPPQFHPFSDDCAVKLNSKTATGIVQPLYENIKARHEVFVRWKETKEKVLKFLETCRSLNQAAKVWPEIVHFLPEERRKRLEEDNKPKVKKERTTPAPEEVLGQINSDAIAGDLVALRFATA